MLGPLVVAALTLLVSIATGGAALGYSPTNFEGRRTETRRHRQLTDSQLVCGSLRLGAGLLGALPWLLLLSVLTFPMVSSAAFRAFSCEDFDDGRGGGEVSSYLRADYAVRCGGAEHARAKSLAWLGIAIYPCGVSLCYVFLLFGERTAIREDRPTARRQALAILLQVIIPPSLPPSLGCLYPSLVAPPLPWVPLPLHADADASQPCPTLPAHPSSPRHSGGRTTALATSGGS